MARPTAAQHDVIEAYAANFRADLVDLSCPSPHFEGYFAVDTTTVDPGFPIPGGSFELRERIARLYQRLEADDILVTSGASEALAALAAALARPGEPVAVTDGAYPSFTETARLAGARLVDSAEARGATALLASNPTVPGGRRVALEALIARALATGAVPVVDEVYRHIVLNGRPPVAAADLHPAAVSVGDLSKTLGLGGLRIGWIATRNAAVRAAAARWLRLLTGGPSVLSEAAACAALKTFDEQVARHTDQARENAPRVYEVLRAAGWSFERAELGLTVCATPPAPVDGAALERLRTNGFFLLPADSFGRAGAFRIGLLTPPERLATALDVLHSEPRRCLVVLGRTPEMGRGKTRLAATLGDQATYELARAFFDDTCGLAAAGERGGSWRSLLLYEGRAPVGRAIEATPQPLGDLGTRIRAGLEAGLKRGERVVLIGTDTPDVARAYLDGAFEALEEADVVIGPARDGGFTLIGVQDTLSLDPSIFDGVEWSTSTVFEQTVANLERLGLRVAVLDEREDVDDIGSLGRLARRLDGEAAEVAPRTRAALAAVFAEVRA